MVFLDPGIWVAALRSPLEFDVRRMGHQVSLPLGVYHVTESIRPLYRRLFHIPARDGTATVKVTVVKGPNCCPVPGCCLPSHPRPPHRTGLPARAPAVPYLKNPPRAIRPDLVALPAWQISVHHAPKRDKDYLDFAATVWIGGHSKLDVEGFRSHASPVMQSYQYFWRNGKVVGRARAGTGLRPQKRRRSVGQVAAGAGVIRER